MRLSAPLVGLVTALIMPACLLAADAEPASYQTGKLISVYGGHDTSWIGDCGGCSSCNPRLLPSLIGGFARLLDDVFRCPSCRDGGSFIGKGPVARPYLDTLPLVSIKFGGHAGCGKSYRRCDSCGGNSSVTPIGAPSVPLDEAPTPHDVVWKKSPATGLLANKPRRNTRKEAVPTGRRAPRPLTVSTATWINQERRHEKSEDEDQSPVKPTSGSEPLQQIPHNPLRDK